MNFKAAHWAVHEVGGLKPLERLLLLVLAEHADDRDCVWSSQDRLAHMMGTSPSTLRRCLGRLERLGLLTHEYRWAMDESTDTLRMKDVYQLHVGAAPDWAAPQRQLTRISSDRTPQAKRVRAQAGGPTHQGPQGQSNAPAGERRSQLRYPPGSERQRPCGGPEQLVQLSRLLTGVVTRLHPGDYPP